MRNYEVTFIVDPVLSGDEIKSAASAYVDHLKGEGCEIIHVDEMGLRELAYPINKRNTGVYYCVEFSNETGEFIPKLELAMRRDERIIRYLTVKLDKYGVKYNADKRAGLIGKKSKEDKNASSNGKAKADKVPADEKKGRSTKRKASSEEEE